MTVEEVIKNIRAIEEKTGKKIVAVEFNGGISRIEFSGINI